VRRIAVLALQASALITLLTANAALAAPRNADSTRRTVVEALSMGRPVLLKPLLPTDAKVNLALRTIAPARGLHDGGQFLVLLTRFFERCSALGFKLTPGESGVDGAVRLGGILATGCPGGRTELGLQIVLERSGDGWRLSEVWETE
jgi:hypothetical protein